MNKLSSAPEDAAPGRMALSNYLLQTFLGISIFYAIGFGLHLKGAPLSLVAIAIVVFVLQIIVSNLWFKQFAYGPVEWIWRMLTYGKRLPIRRVMAPQTLRKVQQ